MTFEFKIYDYLDTPKVCSVELAKGEFIEKFSVLVLSGDEIVDLTTNYGNKYHFDSSNDRFEGFFDDEYSVDTDYLYAWVKLGEDKLDIDFMLVPSLSYQRADKWKERFE